MRLRSAQAALRRMIWPGQRRDTRRAMSQENVEVVRLAFAAFERGDVAAVEALYAPDVEWSDVQHAPDVERVVHGWDAVKRIWAGWVESFGDFRAEIEEYIDAGDWVICLTHWRGSGTASGASFDIRSADAYEVRDGKIVRAWGGYGSKEEALEA